MRRAISIVLYVISGFFLYSIALTGFLNVPPIAAKFVMMGMFSVPAIGFLLGGLWASQFSNWRRDTGIVTLSAALFTAFMALTFVCMLADPEVQRMLPDTKLEFFNDCITGGAAIAFLGLCGAYLLWSSRRRIPARIQHGPQGESGPAPAQGETEQTQQ